MKQLLTSIFGSTDNKEALSKDSVLLDELVMDTSGCDKKEDSESSSVSLLEENINRTGWKLVVLYKNHDEQVVDFSIRRYDVGEVKSNDISKNILKNIVANIHSQLMSEDEDTGFINVDNCFVIRKSQFMSVAIAAIG